MSSCENLKKLSQMSVEELRGLPEKGEERVAQDEHGPAFPEPEDALRAAREIGIFPDPAKAGKPARVINALASPGETDFRCQAYGYGKRARCERCGTNWDVGPDSPPCKDHAVPGWIHAVAPHGPRHTVLVEDKRPKPYHGLTPPRAGIDVCSDAGREFDQAGDKAREIYKRPELAAPYGKQNKVSRPKADGGGLRFSLGKCKIDLVPPEWVWALAMVLTRGAIKYAVRNWERGMKWSEVVGPMFRHAFKFICGERYDSETGCHHMAMVAWNALVLMTYDIREVGENDLVGEMPWLDLVATDMGPELKATFDKRMAEAAGRK
jgi:hypothetical protein